MKVTAYGQTDVGLKRTKNEDNLLVDEKLGLFVVADGMGGHRGGELASKIAVESMQHVVKVHCDEHTFLSPRAMIEEGYTEASAKIFLESQKNDKSLEGMGTTLVAAFFHEDHLYIGNVGDSRAYLFNEHAMWQLTEDHSLVNEHLKAGLLRDSEIDDFQAKNIITRSVGFEKNVSCDIVKKSLQPGDKFLLCSDGLCGLVDDRTIHSVVKSANKEDAVATCIEKAKEAGGDDNITVVIIEVS